MDRGRTDILARGRHGGRSAGDILLHGLLLLSLSAFHAEAAAPKFSVLRDGLIIIEITEGTWPFFSLCLDSFLCRSSFVTRKVLRMGSSSPIM